MSVFAGNHHATVTDEGSVNSGDLGLGSWVWVSDKGCLELGACN